MKKKNNGEILYNLDLRVEVVKYKIDNLNFKRSDKLKFDDN